MKEKKYSRIILLLSVTGMTFGMLSACSNQNLPNPVQTPESLTEIGQTTQNPETTEEGAKEVAPTEGESGKEDESLKASPAVYLNYPKDATVTETDDGIYVETDDYLLYQFETDTFRDGAVYGNMEVLALINEPGREEEAKELLRLKNYVLPDHSNVTLYNHLNGMHAFQRPLSEMEYDANGHRAAGDGILMVYQKKEGIGVYVVLGIVKDGKKEIPEELEKCTKSLMTSGEAEEKYVVAEESMPDGTPFRVAYPKGSIFETEKDGEGISLYYDRESGGHFLIKHDRIEGGSSSANQMRALLEDLMTREEQLTFTDPTIVKGKLEYETVTLTYKSDDREITEQICLTYREDGSLWIVDLYGREDQVKAQEENLKTLLWSLEELE